MSEEGAFDVARKSIYWVLVGFIIMILVMAFVFIIANYKNRLLHVPEEVQAEFIALRFTHIPECFAYQDGPSGRVYPSVIDIAKFTDEQMLKCYRLPEEKGYKELNFQLALEKAGKTVKTNEYFNVPKFKQKRTVLVKEEGKALQQDILIISTQAGLLSRPKT